MSAISTAQATSSGNRAGELIISADSHVMEPHDLWVTRLPKALRDVAPTYPPPKVGEGFQAHPGGTDPHERLKEMATDGVSAEVLYPTLGLGQFGLDDATLQEACFRVYNDWLIDYCQVNNDRLVGIPCISMYYIDHAVQELERCKKAGLQGALIWQAAHPELPLYSDHYDKFWDAAQSLEMPISLHILTGHNYSKHMDRRKGVEHYRGSVNLKMSSGTDAWFDLMFYGVFDKYPRLNFVWVEFEIGWIPFYLQQWGYYYRRFRGVNPPPMQLDPRDYWKRQIYATFFNDAVGARYFDWGDADNYMWSNDYPHPNSTWPHSLEVIERDLGTLPAEKRAKLVRDNVSKLYNLRVAEPAVV